MLDGAWIESIPQFSIWTMICRKGVQFINDGIFIAACLFGRTAWTRSYSYRTQRNGIGLFFWIVNAMTVMWCCRSCCCRCSRRRSWFTSIMWRRRRLMWIRCTLQISFRIQAILRCARTAAWRFFILQRLMFNTSQIWNASFQMGDHIGQWISMTWLIIVIMFLFDARVAGVSTRIFGWIRMQ